MKKLLIAAILLINSQNIFAQLSKGMIAVGVASGIGAGKNENETNYNNGAPSNYYYDYTNKSTTFNIAPSASYFISKHFAVGAQIGYTGYVSKTEQTSKYHAPASMNYDYSKTASAGINMMPYVKYYLPLGDSSNIYFLLEGSYGVTISSGKTSGYNETTNYDANGNGTSTVRNSEFGPNKTNTIGMNFGISPGLLFMPSKKIGLEFSLGNLIGVHSSVGKTTNNNGDTSKNTTTSLEYFNFNTFSVNTGIYYFFK